MTSTGIPARAGRAAACLLAASILVVAQPADGQTFEPGGPDDPRIGLSAGWHDAEEASWNMRLLSNIPKPTGFYDPANPGDNSYSNSDLAHQGDLAFVGNYVGLNIYDVSDPRNPELVTSILCPGGQGDVSVYGNLVFLSVQETRGRLDCGPDAPEAPVDPERFRGVRILDISDVRNPVQVAAVQTCRGSHTHTVISTDPNDPGILYLYNSGTSTARPADELAGCVDVRDANDPTTAYWSIDVIEVPLAAPERARVIESPRVFADGETGRIDGLHAGGDHGDGTQDSRETNQCHDITAYPELGIAAGACSGNGILFDITNPRVPVRIDEVIDPNFAYWHSATFNNDGTAVIFTDEWGGGGAPRCLATDPAEWGANAIFRVADGRMQHASYYKLPAPQTEFENCVAHNGSLVPVPGRDIKVQAWYQGGISVFDFTDPSNPFEIAFFDRGPMSDAEPLRGGHWSAYWHNGFIYGSEKTRGLDVLELLPNEHLTENELAAAKLVHFDEFNPQQQPRVVWPAAFVVARAFLDQAERHESIPAARVQQIATELDRIEMRPAGSERRADLAELAA
ncbi:MAG TPA: hypothetical protein VMN39_07220, partial [Longimicrobiaceae bacterium]|nr:hypothetical protein [Longimicrobiaceae bacterium]